jgi:hypothetical protein
MSYLAFSPTSYCWLGTNFCSPPDPAIRQRRLEWQLRVIFNLRTRAELDWCTSTTGSAERTQTLRSRASCRHRGTARRQETSGQETRNRDKFHCPLQIGGGRGGGAG